MDTDIRRMGDLLVDIHGIATRDFILQWTMLVLQTMLVSWGLWLLHPVCTNMGATIAWQIELFVEHISFCWMDQSNDQQEIDSLFVLLLLTTFRPPLQVKELPCDESAFFSISICWQNRSNENKMKEKKPFDLLEELKKPYVVGIKPEYVEVVWWFL